MNKYDFTKKAILCETWEQMGRLAEIAEKQGHESWNFNKDDFYRKSMQYFGLTKSYPWYTNFSTASVMSDDIVITYADFIASGVEDSNGSEDKKLEDEAAKYEDATPHNGLGSAIFKAGASWQKQQQGWSDEDMENAAFYGCHGFNKIAFNEWLSNYKKQKLQK